MDSEKVKYFRDENGLTAFNVRTLKVFRFRSDLKNVLPQILPEDYTEAQKEAFIDSTDRIENENFRNYMKLLAFDEPYTILHGNIDVLTISFPTVHRCNLQCRYCYADAGENYCGKVKEMDASMIDDIIRYSLTKLAPNCKFIQISLVSGGEPLLNIGIMKEIDQIIDKYRPGIKRKVFIATNLTLLNEKHIGLFDEIRPQIAVSIDGPREMHDLMRVYKDGRGTYDDVIRKYKMLCEKSTVTKTKMPMFMTVLTEQNLDLVSIIKHHLELGALSIQVKIARGDESKHGISEKNVDEFINAYNRLAEYLKECFSEKDLKPILAIVNGNDTMGKLIKNVILTESNCFRCGAGKDRFSFTAEGDIYPCDNFVGMEQYRMGSIYSDEKNVGDVDFFSVNVDSSKICRGCWARYLCSGDCYFNSLIRTGSLGEPDKNMCRFFLALSETVIKLIVSLEDTDRELFKKLKRLISVRENNNFIH